MSNKFSPNDLALTILMKYEEFCYQQITDINSSLILLFWHIGQTINHLKPLKNQTQHEFWESIEVQLLPEFGKFFLSHELRSMTRFYETVPDINQAITISNNFSWHLICKIIQSNQLKKLTTKIQKTSKTQKNTNNRKTIILTDNMFLNYCHLLSSKKSSKKIIISPANSKLAITIKKNLHTYISTQNHIHNFRFNMFAWELGKTITHFHKNHIISLNKIINKLQSTTLSKNFLQQSALYYSKIGDYDTAIQISNLLPWKFISRIIHSADSTKILSFAYYLNKMQLSSSELSSFFKNIKYLKMSELTPKENSYRSLITSIDTKKGRNYKMEIVTKKLTSSITNEKRKLTFNICDSRLFKKILKNSL